MNKAAREIILVSLMMGQLAAASVDDPSEVIRKELAIVDFTVQPLLLPTQPQGTTGLIVTLGAQDVALTLHPHSLRGDAFTLWVDAGAGLVATAPPAVSTWRGEITSQNGASLGVARASITAGSMQAMLWLDDGRTFAVQPLAQVFATAGPELHVVYDVADCHDSTPWYCATDSSGKPFVADSTPPSALFATTGLAVCEIAADADVQYYAKNGNSVPNTVADIESVLNLAEGIYEHDVAITYELTAIVVRTSVASNPYTTNDASSLLAEFKNHWLTTKTAIPRDVAQLFTNRNIVFQTANVVGLAFLDGICTPDAFSLVKSKFTTNMVQRVALSAHELGHNWNAIHCTGLDCRIMCETMGGCANDLTQFGTFSKSTINAYKATKTCLADEQSPVALPFHDPFPTTAFDVANWAWVDGAVIDASGIGAPSGPNSVALNALGVNEFEDDELRSNFIRAASGTNIEVEFSAQHIGVENGESLFAEYLNNAQSWQLLQQINSDGVDQTSFTRYQTPLPSDGYHDELRLRFRSEVDGADDVWHLDDVYVGTPIPAVPALQAVSPQNTKVLPAAKITLSGDHFSGTTQVAVGSLVLNPGSFVVVDDQTITFTAPIPTAIGPQAVAVTNSLGTSNAMTLTYDPVPTPVLQAPDIVFNGSGVGLKWAGDPFDLPFMSVNVVNSTFQFNGLTLLTPALLFAFPQLNAAGYHSIAPIINGVPNATTIRVQMLMIDPGSAGPATLEVTTIKQIIVV